MGMDGIVVTPPGFDEDQGFSQRVEALPVEELVTQPRIEALDVADLQGRAGRDEGRADPDRGDPLLDGLGNELRAVVGSDADRNPAHQEQIGQDFDDIRRGRRSLHSDRQALTGELDQHIEHPKGSPIVGPVIDEVIGPDMVPPLRAQPDALAIVQPKASPVFLANRHLQPLASPQTLDPLVGDLRPPGAAGCNPSVWVPLIVAGVFGEF